MITSLLNTLSFLSASTVPVAAMGYRANISENKMLILLGLGTVISCGAMILRYNEKEGIPYFDLIVSGALSIIGQWKSRQYQVQTRHSQAQTKEYQSTISVGRAPQP